MFANIMKHQTSVLRNAKITELDGKPVIRTNGGKASDRLTLKPPPCREPMGFPLLAQQTHRRWPRNVPFFQRELDKLWRFEL